MKRTSILFCCLFAITANFIAPAAKAQVNTTDSLALVDLYNSTDGSNWTNHTNWLTANPVSTWYQVGVTNNRVTTLNIVGNNLSGTIPATIGNLTNLTSFDLAINQLTGTIPAQIGNLTNLTLLDVNNNQLSGAIPASVGNLTKLYDLDLATNQLSGAIPAEIGNLTNLPYLELDGNQLSGAIPAEIGNLASLLSAQLGGNQLSGTIPATLGNLTSLKTLDVHNNQLSGAIPSTLGNLGNLSYLYLNNNQLSGTIPAEIGSIKRLAQLSLAYNQLSGAVPASFHKLTNLTRLDLSFNQLSTFGYTSVALSISSKISGFINNNLFTFNELQFIAKNYRKIAYVPQDTILPIHQSGGKLSVYAGGTVSDNTYTWHKMGSTDSTTIKGNLNFTPSSSGQYYAYVTNGVAKRLTLYSDTISYTMPLQSNAAFLANNTAQIKSADGKFSIYPNPASSTIHIQTAGTATIVLTNSAGKVLLTRTINNSDVINVSSFANGVYYIQNKTTGETQKVVVVH